MRQFLGAAQEVIRNRNIEVDPQKNANQDGLGRKRAPERESAALLEQIVVPAETLQVFCQLSIRVAAHFDIVFLLVSGFCHLFFYR